jgi:KaiC/GvpD/RAD55 family RecA-like ATPase
MSTAQPQLVPDPAPSAPAEPQTSPLTQLKQEYGLYHGADVISAVRRLPPSNHLIDGMIPPGTVSILVGDSGIGKTPLAYQLALSLAAGVPFLGLPVKRSRVLLVDFENSLRDAHWMLEQLRKHLRLATYPDNFLLWPAHLAPQDPGAPFRMVEKQLNRNGMNPGVSQVIRMLAPDLVIVDSLRSFNPEMERDNAVAAWQIKSLREIAKAQGTAFLLIHHVRKQRMRDGTGSFRGLEDGAAMDWLLQTAGARALINQTDVRLAVAPPARRDNDAIALLLRGHSRTRGEIGPYLLRRVLDNAGEPSGYERLAPTTSLLKSVEQEAIFLQLPESFAFGDALRITGGHPQTASRLLHDLARLGLVRKVARGQYQKCGIAEAA